MASEGSLQVYDIEAFLEISPSSGAAPLPITRFSAQFALNSIPQASCSVALGVDAKGGKVSSIHNVLTNSLQYRVPARVFVKVKLAHEEKQPNITVSKDKIFDGGTFVAFEGYMSGSGYRRSGNTIEYTVSLEHWLSDLAIASGMSQDIQPGTSHDFVFPATFYDPQLRTGNFLVPAMASRRALAGAISGDVWEGIKAFLLEICNNSSPVGLGDIYSTPKSFRSNGPAAAALGKFIETAPYQSMKLLGVNSDTAKRIGDTLVSKAESTYIGSSIWDNLIVYSSALMFNVCPLIEKAVVGQKNPNLRTVHKKITAAEVFSFDLSTNMPRFISGVVLKNSTPAGNNYLQAQLPAQGKTMRNMVVGSYFVGASVEGTVAFHHVPEWLMDPSVPDMKPAMPAPMGVAPLPKGQGAPANTVANNMRGFGNRYAQAMYGNEVLKYRNGQLSGRLRFDIAPGSIVEVEASKNIAVADDKLSNSLVAHVDSVAIYIDASSGQASTAFGLSSIRYGEENQSDITIDKNPMYAGSFNGGPLHLGNL